VSRYADGCVRALCVAPGVLFESISGTAFLALTSIPQTLHRIVHEELALRRHFGERYEEYRRRTGKLLPRWARHPAR